MSALSSPDRADLHHRSPTRIPILAAVCLLGPVAYGIQWWRGEPIHPIDVMIGSGVLFLLVLAKMSGLMKAVGSTVDDLKTSEEKYRSIVETTNEWIWELDVSLTHTYSNPAVEAILGYRPDELVGTQTMELIHPEDTPHGMAQVLAAMAAGTGWEGAILRWKHRDGSYRYLESTATPIVDDAGTTIGWRGADRDVSERVRADAERIALQERLHESQKMEAIGRLAGGVAHDFNNLLTVIINNAIFLESEIATGSEAARDLSAVTQAAKRGADLVRQLLAFARKETIEKQVVELNDMVKSVGMLLARIGGENVHIQTDLGKGLGPILADQGQIEQILVNLTLNAFDAMPRGGTVVVSTSTFVRDGRDSFTSEVPEGDFVCLRVSDTGTGIPEDALPHIFEPFYTTKGRSEGTGLGLATVYGIVEGSGGHINVTSSPDRGTTFEILFPVTTPAAPPAEMKASARAERGTGQSILVAEDEDAVRTLVQRILVRGGYRVLAARNGDEALALFEGAGRIDLLLTDVIMPGMSGTELAGILTESDPSLPTIMMSGYADDLLDPSPLDRPEESFLHKPFSAEDLLGKVRARLTKPLIHKT
jgi:PAS domain S-box-containing protein